ncbi:MAG: hypothetical protein ACXVB1_06925 [Pseudobdellovibrionaceae bacterium]
MIKSFTKPFLALVFVLLNLTLTSEMAHADSKGRNAKEFYNLIENYRRSSSNECLSPIKSKLVFDIHQSDESLLSSEVKSDLDKIAFFQAQIWGDTILEGDYFSEGSVQLENVLSLFQNKSLVGYKITYSGRAWFTGDCDFDGKNTETLKDCQEGRIYESTYVSPDFKTFFSEDVANFTK